MKPSTEPTNSAPRERISLSSAASKVETQTPSKKKDQPTKVSGDEKKKGNQKQLSDRLAEGDAVTRPALLLYRSFNNMINGLIRDEKIDDDKACCAVLKGLYYDHFRPTVTPKSLPAGGKKSDPSTQSLGKQPGTVQSKIGMNDLATFARKLFPSTLNRRFVFDGSVMKPLDQEARDKEHFEECKLLLEDENLCKQVAKLYRLNSTIVLNKPSPDDWKQNCRTINPLKKEYLESLDDASGHVQSHYAYAAAYKATMAARGKQKQFDEMVNEGADRMINIYNSVLGKDHTHGSKLMEGLHQIDKPVLQSGNAFFFSPFVLSMLSPRKMAAALSGPFQIIWKNTLTEQAILQKIDKTEEKDAALLDAKNKLPHLGSWTGCKPAATAASKK